jgi:hypothetical protein
MVSLMGGEDWDTTTQRALQRSKLLLAVLTPAYFTSPHWGGEWRAFERREGFAGPLILPIVLQGKTRQMPPSVLQRPLLRAPDDTLVALSKNVHDVAYAKFLQEAASALDRLLSVVPPYDDAFPLPEPNVMQGEPSLPKLSS